MPLSNLGEQISLNRLFAGAGAVGTIQGALGAAGGVNYFIHLHSSAHASAPSDTSMGTAYDSAGGGVGGDVAYAPQELTFTPKTESTSTASNIISLTSTVTFTTSAADDWAVISTYSIHACASSDTNGSTAATANMIFYGTFAGDPVTVGLGDTVQIVSGGAGLAIQAE